MRANLDFRFRPAWPEPLLVILWIAAAAIIATVDYVTGNLSVFVLYALLVAAVSLLLGIWNGVAASVIGTIALFTIQQATAGVPAAGLDYVNACANLLVLLLVVAIAAEMKNVIVRDQILSREDPLTGVLNMRSFRTLLELEIARFQRRKRAFSVAYIDLDNFRSVNDTAGHSSGDDLLRDAADSMKKCVRVLDSVGRVGGDEFAILLPETNAEESSVAVERIRKACQAAFGRRHRKVTLSVGLATFTRVPKNPNEIFRRADSLMLRAKKGGKGRVVRDVF